MDSGVLAIGVDPFLVSSVLSPVLKQFIGEHPSFKVVVQTGGYETLEKSLLGGELDVIFGFDPQFRTAGIDLETFQMSNARVVCNPNHPLTGLSSASLPDVFEYSVVSLSLPAWFISFARERLNQPKLDAPIRDQLVLEADNIEVVKAIVMSSDAVTGAFPMDIEKELRTGDLVLLQVEDWPKEITAFVGRRIGRPSSPAQSLLEKMFVEMAMELSW
jgi:DNA-binding transcriptional LysR family regulator